MNAKTTTTTTSEIPCTCCSLKLTVEIAKVNSTTGTYCIYWNGHLMCNGGLFFDPLEGELHKKHFFYNEQMYTSNMFRHILMYIHKVEESFHSLQEECKQFEQIGLKRIKIC